LAASQQQSTFQQDAKYRIAAQLAAREIVGERTGAAVRLAGAIN
jgi:hypothetical protein